MTTLASRSQAVDVENRKNHSLDMAILLPGSLSAPHSRPAPSHSVSPSTIVGGVPLFLRTILTLQRATINKIVIMCDAEEESLRMMAKDARVRIAIHWMPVLAFRVGDPQTWSGLGKDDGAYLVIGEPVAFSKTLIEELQEKVRTGADGVLWPTSVDLPREPAARLAVIPGKLFKDESWRAIVEMQNGWERAYLHAITAGLLKPVPISSQSPGWVRSLRTVEDVARAEQRMLAAAKSSMDGVVDTYFNRKAAAGLTRLFLKARWGPNAVTALSLLIGLTAAGSFAHGTYWSGVIGAFLFQLSAVVDCCDGDVARLTFRESRFGERLDLFGDNVVHMAIFGAIGWAGYLNGGGWLSIMLGLLAMIGSACSLWVVTRMKTITEKSTVSRDFIVKNVANRDFSIVVILFSLLNLLGIFLWFAAIGSNMFWMITAWLTRSPAIRA